MITRIYVYLYPRATRYSLSPSLSVQTNMKSLWRGVAGRRHAFRCREEKYGAVTIQRIFRGYLGRRRAARERDKFLFSKSQSQGIEFGRQMLLEHKLHGTRLQSDVQLLTGEKVGSHGTQGGEDFMCIYMCVGYRRLNNWGR